MSEDQDEYEIVAEFTPDHRIGALDPSIQEFDTFLRSKGITKYGLDGSRSYYVTVSSAQAERTRQVLKRMHLKSGEVKVIERKR
jgi:hypothetical protein